MPNIIKARFKLRSGTTAEWLAHDEVLANAEVGEEITTSGERLRKIGNGVDKWSDLPYRINLPIDRSVPPDDNQTLVYNASTGLLEWADGGGIASIETQDSQGIALTGDGTPTSKLKATPIISAVSGNKLSVKSDGLFTDSGGIHIDNRVSNYANLPSPPTEGTGATYLVEADGLIYVWDGSAWPAEGDGIAINGGGLDWNKPHGSADPHIDSVKLLVLAEPADIGPFRLSVAPSSVPALAPTSDLPATNLEDWPGQPSKFKIMVFDGSAELDMPRDWQIGSQDATFEAEIYRTSTSTTHDPILSCGYQAGFSFYISNSSNQVVFQARNDSTGVQTGVDVGMNAWHHVATTIESGVARVWLDGAQIGSSWNMGGAISILTDPVHIGWEPNDDNRHSHMKIRNARITIGVARYTTSFSPPTGVLPNH